MVDEPIKSCIPARSGEWISGNIFIRPNHMQEVGMTISGHEHNFDHTTIVFTGSVHVKAKLPDGTIREGDFKAPSHFLVRKDVSHEITSLEPNTIFWCVYSHRTPQGEISQVFDGWMTSYV
jgi:hypothetical protein